MESFKNIISKLILVVYLSTIICEANTIVDAPAGRFQGFIDTAPQGQSYVAFRGIPYAKPPVAELRFAKPQPLDRLDRIFDATKEGRVCPIPEIYEQMIDAEHGYEDCLLLNIYTKQINTKSPRKVMVYIHGGGYFVGSGKEMVFGNMVTSHDVILVTINYRLGALGFLGTGDEASPGNYGLWDMTMALQWVKSNIASFGGDPSDVAISGESAGASAVGYLSISPHTKGLFTKVFPMSGSPSSTFGRALTPLMSTLKIAKTLKCFEGEESDEVDSKTTKTVVECLRRVPVNEISSMMGFSLDKVEFVPTVDNDFIPRHPLKLLQDDKYLTSVDFFKRSYLVGLDNNENSIFITHVNMMKGAIAQQEGMTLEEKETLITQLVESSFSFYLGSRFDTDVPKKVIDKVVDWYERRYVNQTLSQIIGDLSFIIPTYDFINAISRKDDTKVWLFHFNHYPKYMKGQFRGIVHALDLGYWSDQTLEQIEKVVFAGIDHAMGMDTEDLDLKSQLSSIIATFTQTGSPPATVGGVAWPAYSAKVKGYLDLKPRVEVRRDLGEDVRRLWLEDVPRWMEEVKHQHSEL